MRKRQFAHCWSLALLQLAIFTCAAAGADETLRSKSRPTHSAAMKALEISKLAAENDLSELSLRAFSDALGQGLPIAEPTNVGRVEHATQSSRVVILGKITYDPRYLASLIDSKQLELDRIWQKKNFPAGKVYDAMVNAVLPPGDPRSVNLYLRRSSTALSEMPEPSGVGMRLVEWAERAGRLPQLLARLNELNVRADSELDALHLKFEIGIRTGDAELVRAAVSQISERINVSSGIGDGVRALALAMKAVRLGHAPRKSVLPVLNETIDIAFRLSRTDSGKSLHAPAMELLLVAAEAWFQAGEIEKGKECVELYLREGMQPVQRGTPQNGQQHKKQLHEVAAILFDADQPESAFDKLEEAAPQTGKTTGDLSSRLLRSIDRYLQPMSDQQRYEQLHRIMFSGADTKKSLSLISGMSSLNEVGLQSTGLMLIEAAISVGRIEELRQQLSPLVLAEVRGATALLAVVSSRTRKLELAARLIGEQAESVGYDFRTRQKNRNPWTDLMVLAEALKQPELTDAAANLAAEIVEYASRIDAPEVVSTARRLLLPATESNSTVPGLDAWIPAPGSPFASAPSPTLIPSWQTAPGIVSRVCGAGCDSLYVPFPLSGSFDFIVEVDAAEQREAGVGYGGVVFEPGLRNQSVMFRTIGGDQQRPGPLSLVRDSELNDLRLRVRDGNAEVVLNGSPIESSDITAGSSPWISLTARPGQLGSWRFPRIEGNPEIPESVELSGDSDLRGWTTRSFGNTRQRAPLYHAETSSQDSPAETPPQNNWAWKDGVIVGAATVNGKSADVIRDVLFDEPAPNLLQYDRPLQDGDTVNWEFEYGEQLSFGVAIGPVAAEVVKGHYARISLNNRLKTQPKAEHSVTLQEGWNAAALTVGDDNVRLEINGDLVDSWQKPGNFDRQFGYFHDARKSRLRVRNVRLSGDWPQVVPDWLRKGLAAGSATTESAIPDEVWLASPLSVVDRLNQLAPAERFPILMRWLLPSDDDQPLRIAAGIRVSDVMSETQPAPDSPLLLLLSTAEELGVQNEVAARLKQHRPVSGVDRVVSDLVLSLSELWNEDVSEATDRLTMTVEFLAKLDEPKAQKTETPLSSVITLFAFKADQTDDERLHRNVIHLLDHVADVNGHLADHRVYLRSQLMPSQPFNGLSSDVWRSVTYPARAQGQVRLSHSPWRQTNANSVHHVAGNEAALFLSVPLQGSFTVTCELQNDANRAVQVGYNARSINFGGSNERVIHSELFGRMGRRHYLSQSLTDRTNVALKMLVEGRQCTFFAGDRQIFTDSVEQRFDPWFFVLCPAHADGEVRNVEVAGDYQIPDEIHLDCSTWFQGWSAGYFNETLGAGSPWRSSDNVIHARKKATGQKYIESLLQYHRPIFEDGTIRYEFYYKEDQTLLHPAIGQRAFLLEPERGVSIHELTDERYRTEPIAADNRQFFAERQLSSSLPLKNDAWNTLEVNVTADELKLRLNQEPIYRQQLGSAEPRLFGLFHFKDQTDGQVRNITWRGSWPRELPRQLQKAN